MKNIVWMIFFCLCLVSITSCKSKEVETFERLLGMWEIDTIEYQNENYKDSLYLNTLYFEFKNNLSSLTLPKTTEFKREIAVWDVYNNIDNSVVLEIESLNHFFKGIYTIQFFKNKERKLLGVELKSSKMVIVGYKFDED
ncbi:MAG: hypothetical protein PSN34_04795 [Urechidicola sp.]|nr:hypothetical protein [Urechidicola sp.]